MMMFFWPVFVIAGLVMLVAWALRGDHGQLPMMGCMPGHGDTSQLPPERTPLDIVRGRYARGEITKEQFEEMSRILG